MTNFIKTKITLSIDKMNIIKRFIKFKFFWRKPAERNILVYDRVSENLQIFYLAKILIVFTMLDLKALISTYFLKHYLIPV